MQIDIPPGYNVEQVGGEAVRPGARIHLCRMADEKWFTATVQPDGSLEFKED